MSFIKKIDYRFVLILVIGIAFRIFALNFVHFPRDAQHYALTAAEILKGEYNSFRGPAFPLLVALFLLFIGDQELAGRSTSFTFGIIIIFLVYYVFKRAALKVFKDSENCEKKSRDIGFLVSFYISVNYFLAYNCVRGLREEFLMVLLILLFYFVFIVENSNSTKNLLIISILTILLTLSHVTVGLVFYIVLVIYYLIPKIVKTNIFNLKIKGKKVSDLKIFNYNISNSKIIYISISFIASFLGWALFCWLRFNDPFLIFTVQMDVLRYRRDLDISTPEKFLGFMINGLYDGVNLELWILYYMVGPIFLIFVLLTMFKYSNKKQIPFLFVLVIINFLYLSPVMALGEKARLLCYYFQFIFFLGSIFIIDILYERRDIELISFTFLRKNFSLSPKFVFTTYLIIYAIRNAVSLVYLVLLKEFFYDSYLLNTVWILILVIHEIFLLILLIVVKFTVSFRSDRIAAAPT